MERDDDLVPLTRVPRANRHFIENSFPTLARTVRGDYLVERWVAMLADIRSTSLFQYALIRAQRDDAFRSAVIATARLGKSQQPTRGFDDAVRALCGFDSDEPIGKVSYVSTRDVTLFIEAGIPVRHSNAHGFHVPGWAASLRTALTARHLAPDHVLTLLRQARIYPEKRAVYMAVLQLGATSAADLLDL